MIRRGQNRENIAHASSLCCHGAISRSATDAASRTEAADYPSKIDQLPNSGLQVRETLSRNSRPGASHCRRPRRRQSRRHQGRAGRCGVGCCRRRSCPTGPVRPRFLLGQARCYGLRPHPALLNQEIAQIPLKEIGSYPSATPSRATTSQSSKLPRLQRSERYFSG
jgi:hypothetical protein